MSTHRDDRGLDAVRRVREVREQDSRLGLQRAVAEEGAATDRLAGLQGRLADASVPAESSPGALLILRTALGFLGDRVVDARDATRTAEAVTVDARGHWSADRSRLVAVEHLLARRAEQRRREADRREARDADDLAAQRWMRGAAEAAAGTEARR
ncbi:flagellar FliJ family protein [Nocardioides sp. YIM 152588]|uniref:flagellar FliJ family protein n=1 Tax=Nocardioides sp. YIM 152588 TaxID=3158259 RepID=UPI0032E513E3